MTKIMVLVYTTLGFITSQGIEYGEYKDIPSVIVDQSSVVVKSLTEAADWVKSINEKQIGRHEFKLLEINPETGECKTLKIPRWELVTE